MRNLLVLALCAVAGCAPTSVHQTAAGSDAPLPRPTRVLVYDFAVSPDDVSLNEGMLARLQRDRPHLLNVLPHPSTRQQEVALGRRAADALAARLVERLAAMGLPAERAPQGSLPPEGSLAIEGRFVTIDEGNRARRVVIGFGAGRSDVSTETDLYDVRGGALKPLESFKTDAKSSAKPGAAETLGAGAAAGAAGAAAGLGETQATVEADGRRTADALAKQLAPYFVAQGWIAPH